MKLNEWGASILATATVIFCLWGASLSVDQSYDPAYGQAYTGMTSSETLNPIREALDALDVAGKWVAKTTDRIFNPPEPPPVLPLQGDSVPPFPGAVGIGAGSFWTSNGGRCSKDSTVVFKINNLTPNSDGGISAILQDSLTGKPDSVTAFILADTTGFQTSGGGNNNADLSCVFILYQTAQGGAEGGMWNSTVNYSTGYGGFALGESGTDTMKNIVVSHVRVTMPKDTYYVGSPWTSGGTGPDGDAIAIDPQSKHVILVNSEMYGGNDAAGDFPADSGTAMFNLYAMSVDPHGTASLCNNDPLDITSRYGNAYIVAGHRSPCYAARGTPTEAVNNVVYDPGGARYHNIEGGNGPLASEGLATMDEIGNLFIESNDNDNPQILIQLDNSHLTGGGQDTADWYAADTVYFEGNIHAQWGVAADTAHTTLVSWNDRDNDEITGQQALSQADLDNITRGSRNAHFTGAQFPVVPLTLTGVAATDSASILDFVSDSAGASWYVQCDGSRAPRSNAIRDRMFRWAAAGTHSVATGTNPDSLVQADTTGISYGRPTTLTNGNSCADTDGDGLFDVFETNHFGNLSQFRDGDPDNDGFINIVEMAWGTDPTVFTFPDGTQGVEGVVPDLVPAFPGAVGGAAAALDMARDSVRAGTWSLKVWKVSSTDTTSGSSFLEIFRDSLTQANYRTGHLNIVEITVDGWQMMPNQTRPAIQNVYIAGQTAPGGGMYKRGGSWAFRAEGSVRPQDVVMRYITTSNSSNFGMTGHRMYFDHITGRWQGTAGGQHNLSVGLDSTDSQYYTTEYFTLAYSMAYEPLVDHPTTMSFAASPRDEPALRQSLWYRNLSADAGYRTPNTQCDTCTIAQSMVYNWRDRAVGIGSQSILNIMGGFYHTGPATATNTGRDRPFYSHEQCGRVADGDFANTSDSNCTRQIYIGPAKMWYIGERSGSTDIDTVMPGDSIDYWKGADSLITCRDFTNNQAGYINGVATQGQCAASGDTAPTHHKASSFIQHDSWTYPPDTTAMDSTLVEEVLAEVGNSKRLTCAGAWVSRRDVFDSSRVAWIRNNWLDLGGDQGLTQAEAYPGVYNVGAFAGTDMHVSGNPTSIGGDSLTIAEMSPVDGGAWCTDADDDGMPATWEAANGLSDSNAADNDDDPDSDGWLNIEEYLNGTDPNVWNQPDGTEGSPPPPGGAAATYGSSPRRFVYFDSLRGTDTIFRNPDANGVPQNTLIVLGAPAAESIPVGTDYLTVVLDDSLHALFTSLDSLAASNAAIRESTWVDSVLNANTDLCNTRAICSPGGLRSVPIPGDQ